METKTYKNSFHQEDNPYSHRVIYYTKDCWFEPYKGFRIFRRMEFGEDVFDIVDDKDVCVGMYAGINGAKKRIDEILCS